MMQILNTGTPRKGETYGLWFFKMITGPILIILLIVHMIVNHLVAKGGLLTYADVVAYFSNPWIVAMEVTFLFAVVVHALLGLRGIILDMNPSRTMLNAVNWCFSLAGIGAVLYGVWLAITIASRGV